MRRGSAMETSPSQAAPEAGNFYKAPRIPIDFFFPKKIQHQYFSCRCLKLFVSVSQLGFCPVQSCLLQANKTPGASLSLTLTSSASRDEGHLQSNGTCLFHLTIKSSKWRNPVSLEDKTTVCCLVGLQ